MDNHVYGIQCPDYSQVDTKATKLLNMMGGMTQFVNSGEQLALKANLLLAARPDKAVCTHPAVVAAVASLAKEQGAKPLIVDSPGGGYRYSEKVLNKTYQITGMRQAADTAGVEVNLDCSYKEVPFSKGHMVKRFQVITPILEADGVINLCKLKTHIFTYMSGAVKNLFGVIPGLAKPGYHAKLNDTHRFAAMLLDLAVLVSARIHIMDAVVAMEGEGPSAGTPRQVGLLLASTNPIALDAVAGEIIGLEHDQNPVLVEAEKRGLGPHRIEDIEIVGIEARSLRVPDFKTPATYFSGHGLGHLTGIQRMLIPLFKNGLSIKPRVVKDKCTACGTCIKACPMDVITLNKQKYAHIDNDGCIRCYCCHEMCEEEAVELQKSLLYRMLKPA